MRIVQKFGGTSVADIARLENVALRVKREVDQGHQVAVVVSAMAGVTNQLVGYTKAFSNIQNSPEHDAVISTGEQITTGLLALALQQLGLAARSFMGWQIPIYTTATHTNAQITHINPAALEDCFDQGVIPIIAGFQGITLEGRLTTLGRGGSDTTAVAIAAAVKADRCDIYTDVEGVYTADPRIVPKAAKLKQISYTEMLELAAQGAKVLHSRSVETALQHQVPVRVLSSFQDKPGTDVLMPPSINSFLRISGITHKEDWVKIQLKTPPFTSPMLQSLHQGFQEAHIETDFINCQQYTDHTVLSFMVKKADFAKTISFLEKNRYDEEYNELRITQDFAKVSIIGINLLKKKDYTQQFLPILRSLNLIGELTHCSNTRLSFSVPQPQAEKFIQYLHTALKLDQEDESRITEIMAARL